MQKVLLRLALDTLVTAVLLFAAAGTFAWSRAWLLLVVMLLVRVSSAVAAYRVNPILLRERAKFPIHADQPRADRLLLLAVLATGFIALPLIAALDASRWHLLPPPGSLLVGAGLLLFALGWCLKGFALHANAFATAVVRLQSERAHSVADSGVYAVVRHPFYAADPLIYVGLALWLGSYVAALIAFVPVSLMVVRLVLEERFLRRELPGYHAYTLRVPHRLIPGVW
jgi:protein-S-isoprenylcysteine O-methyltransferase Ste14